MKSLTKCKFFAMLLACGIILMFFISGCGSKRVGINEDVRADTGVTNIDIDGLAAQIAEQIDRELTELKGKTVALRSIDNMTTEHFNTQIVGEKIKAALRKKMGAIFVERDRMQVINDEQKMIEETAAHVQERSKLWGADYLLYGRIDSIDKTRSDGWNPITKKQETYYRLTVSVTNTTTSVELWSGQAEFKKTQVKTRW